MSVRWECWRHGGMWTIGWRSGDRWVSLMGHRDLVALDLGHWRIRWTGKNFRPLFSERYGYQKWHRLGRLSARRYETRDMTAEKAEEGRR